MGPFVPAQAGTQNQATLDSRFRGNQQSLGSAPKPSAPMDPFREVRTPERNFGPARLTGGITVTPLARRLAGENGIDLSRVTGSGPHGRIVARDVETRIVQAPARAVSAGPSASDVLALYRDMPFEEVPLDGMRRTIAARLTQAKQTIPHFYLTADVSLDALLKVRSDANAAAPQGDGGYKLSVNDFIIKALALALQQVPAANATWTEAGMLRHKHSDVGVAVAIEGGLFTPVIRHAELKTLGEISNEMKDLAERARKRRLAPHEYQGGTTSISNLGMFGIKSFDAVINPPHATILAVGAGEKRAVVAGDKIEVATLMSCTLSCDHRVVDGATGAELLNAFKALVEDPVRMLV